ncbi:hypothetical protein ACIBJC_37525 [Streptomyces sp. NPDC050509]|uniref:hypothetical protein n=1 Tax=Streptomyces sp. NPDC050509 TaxID=3365620 RepID=UPI0037A357A6
MAVSQLSAEQGPPHAAPPISAASHSSHPSAAPGYGKRSTPGQQPRTAHDFADLPGREAAIAAYIDRLPDGADISVKTLAKHLPYGQCALGTALRTLRATGHLRLGRELVFSASGSGHWVTRTWFSRTARSMAWWTAFVSGELPQPDQRLPPEPEPPPHRPPTRSRALVLLAALGRRAPVLSLSAADCAALEPEAVKWFERGADEETVLRALTTGLPTPVHHPAALVRSRLVSKLPPEPVTAPRPAVLRLMECARCRAPGRPEALLDGECGTCRGAPPLNTRPATLSPARVRDRTTELRAAASPPRERNRA